MTDSENTISVVRPESVAFVVCDGKVKSMTAYTDILSGMAQLGLLG